MRRLQRLIPAVAVLILVLSAGAALGASHPRTLRVRRDVHVTNAALAALAAVPVNKHEAVAVGPAGYAVYTFQGETTHHFICKLTTNPKTNCWAFWPPVSVASASGLSRQTGITGHLGTVRRHGMLQLTLNGQPLYYFTPDLQSGNRRKAGGDELKTYGSIWHIVIAHAGGAGNAAPSPAPMPTGGGGGYAPGY